MESLSTTRMFFLTLTVLSAIFLLHYRVVGQAVYGDGKFYWSYVRSVWKDHDLDLRDELNRVYSPKTNNELRVEKVSKNGVFNWLPIGVSLAWFPAFVFADILANTFHWLIPTFPNNGYSDIYQIIVGLENVFFMSLGIILLDRLLQKYFPRIISFCTSALILFGTNLLFYGGVDVVNSHPLSFLLSVTYLYFWLLTRKKRSMIQWISMGILLSFMTMVRTQEFIFVLPLFIDFIYQKVTFPKKLIHSGLAAIFFAMFFVPQMFAWKYYFGSYFMSPYFQGGFNFLKPHVIQVLFNLREGLLIWTPLYLFCLIGFYFMKLKDHKVFLPILCIFLVQFYLVCSWSGWDHPGREFGIRILMTGLPYLSFGLGALLTRLHKVLSKIQFYGFMTFFIIYNCVSIVTFLKLVH